ncbi:hypothetical protein WAF17_20090 [Bernardetia sp. ABR2-2B]|uniref:hypothetical protein n=1 Tax=Bernardetia sp. ABR2-2B TaxID=3127472 RepID=UPI0030D59535
MVQRTTIITIISVFGLTLFLVFLFLIQKAAWKQENDALKTELDSLKTSSQNLALEFEEKVEQRRISDSLMHRKVYDNYFDAYDAQNFRLYALYKDTERRYGSTSSLARAFNIENSNSIKSNSVLGEMWYIIPVKGVHFVEKKQTWTSIAKKYYHNLNDSTLLKTFNKELKPNRFVIVPFN